MIIEEIDLIRVGTQMDRLVAEKVLGWKHYPDELWERMRDWLTQRREFGWDDRTPEEFKPRMMIDVEGRSAWPGRYSTDISYAWLIIEHLESSAWHCGFKLENLDPDNSWRCEITAWKEGQEELIDVSAEAETAPLAICRAALKIML